MKTDNGRMRSVMDDHQNASDTVVWRRSGVEQRIQARAIHSDHGLARIAGGLALWFSVWVAVGFTIAETATAAPRSSTIAHGVAVVA